MKSSTYLYLDFRILASDSVGSRLVNRLADFDRNGSGSIDTPEESQDVQDVLCHESPDLWHRFLEVARRQPVTTVGAPFFVGDTVEYRGSNPDLAWTIWKVLDITDRNVRLELVEGRYRSWDDRESGPGFVANFSSSDAYVEAHPGCRPHDQIFEEFIKIRTWGEALFRVADTVEYCGPDSNKAGTIWKVLDITDRIVRLELVEGRYKWNWSGQEFGPGHVGSFCSSRDYMKAHPGCHPNDQIFENFRKTRVSRG